MGFFSRKRHNKSASPSSVCTSTPSSPSSSSSTLAPTPDNVPQVITPKLILRVALDPVPLDREHGMFYIEVDPRGGVAAAREAISAKIGPVGMSLFKVSIPWQAQCQARTYHESYGVPVNLITSFSSFNLDDPEQYAASIGHADRQGNGAQLTSITLEDWFAGSTIASDAISILVRTCPVCPSSSIPLTMQVHFAPKDVRRVSLHSRPGSSSSLRSLSTAAKLERRMPPAVVDVAPCSTVAELKAAALKADGRPVSCLDNMVLWRVEMSHEEILVIEDRDGLKGGRMPWPYPPTSPEPKALADDSLPISHYFPSAYSNGNIVTLSVWIDTAAFDKLARTIPSDDQPVFQPLMPVAEHLLSPNPSRAPRSPALDSSSSPRMAPLPAVSPSTLPLGDRRPSRARPSTAPAVIGSDCAKPSTASATSSTSTKRTPRPLGRLTHTSSTVHTASPLSKTTTLSAPVAPLSPSLSPPHGLGISATPRPSLTVNTQPGSTPRSGSGSSTSVSVSGSWSGSRSRSRPTGTGSASEVRSVSGSVSSRSTSSRAPSLDFSTLSLSTDELELRTPEVEVRGLVLSPSSPLSPPSPVLSLSAQWAQVDTKGHRRGALGLGH